MAKSWDEINRSSGTYKQRTWDSINEESKRQKEEDDRRRMEQEKRSQEDKARLASEETSQMGDFQAGVKSGVLSLKQLASGAIALFGDATGNESVRKYGVDKYKKFEEASKPYQEGRPTSVEDIKSVGSAIDWAQFQLGNLTPSAIESIGSAVIGAVIGSSVPGAGTAIGGVAGFVAKGTTKKFLEKKVTEYVAKGIAKDVAEESAKKALERTAGASIAMFANSYVQGTGDVYGETMDENGDGNAPASFLAAIPYAALDTIVDMSVIGKIVKGSEGEKALARYSKSILGSGLKEGAQESAQEADLILAGIASGKEYSSEEVISRLGNSFAAAGLGGSVAGIPGGRKTSTITKEEFSKAQDKENELEEQVQKNPDDEETIGKLAQWKKEVSDYETAFKERPVYVSENEQSQPILQIETVVYPDGKASYSFSADTGNTAIAANFDRKNTVSTKEEAIKKASETIKTWVEEQIATASDEAEAMKFQRIFDEADALITGKAKFEPVAPSIKEGVSDTSAQEIKTPDSVTDNYVKKAESAGTFEEFKDGLDQSTLISRIAPDIQLDDRNGVEKALKAFYDKNKKQVDTVEKGEDKPKKEDEKPLVQSDAQVEKPITASAENGKKNLKKKKEQPKEKPARRFGKKSEVNNTDVGEEATQLTETMQKLVSTLKVDENGAVYALKDRSTRGKDGKFTGSEAINSIGKEEIEKALSGPEMLSVMKKMQKTLNPEIRNILAIKVAEKIVAGKGDSQFDVLGLFNPDIMTVFLDGSLSKKDAEYIFMHEVNHAAFTMFPADKRQMVIDWYKNLSESEKINLYTDKGVNGGDTFSRYEKLSRGRDDQEAFMADETFNRYINKNPDERSDLRKEFDDIVTALLKLVQRILDVVYKSQRFGKTVRNRQITEAYYNAFRNKKGVFESSEATKKILELRGAKPGTIDFVGETRGYGPEFARAKSEPKPDTKTVRFAKIISRRRELRALKRKREADFLATEEGNQVALETEAARENYESPNENIVQGIKNSTYFSKEGSISDAMGEGYLMEKKGRYVVAEASRKDTYVQRGYQTVMEIDSMAAEAGFERGQDYLQDQFDRRKLPDTTESAIRRILKDRDQIYGKVDEELAKLEIELSEAKEGKGAFYQGMRVGSAIMGTRYNERLKVFRDRKAKVRAAKDFFGLSDSDFKKIGGARDVQTMGESEFQGFLNHIQVQAEKVILRSQAMELLVGQIQEKQLKRYDNLRRAMKLPAIYKMTTEQIKEFDAALEFSQEGDEFFTQRQLETVKNTELIGIKTVREARDRLAARLNMPLEALGTIKVSPTLDRVRFDAAIAEANPFYGMLVAETNTATLEAEGRFITIEEEINRLITAARKSRNRGISERLIPKDSRIFAYLEATDKTGLALDMTKEELEAAEFIRRRYEEMRDYLVGKEMLKQYRDNYITHVRKGFLETLRDDGIVGAFKSLIEQQQEDKAVFNILAGDTGSILPLEKFFQYSLKRTGELKPTENVATAFLAYTKAFEKKRSLDKIMPKLDIYTYSIQPKKATKTNLLMDRSLKRFLNDYLNNKKGRRFDFGGFVEQGGKLDIALLFARAFTTLLDLGFSIPGGISSNIGEQSATFVSLGVKRYAKGSARYATFRGRRFLKKYRNFTGKNPWSELAEASKTTGDKFNSGLFVLFRDAQVRANQQFLLGSITDQEYKSGEISPARLAEMNIEMGRWRVVDGAKSIFGSTSVGGAIMQYRGWAAPIFRTTIKDSETIIRNIKDVGLGKAIYSKEGAELFRSVLVMGTAGLMVRALLFSDEDSEKEKSFAEKLIDKSVRDLLSTIGVFDPTFFISEPRVLRFLGDMAAAMKSIGLLEEYTDDAKDGSYQAGDLKGVKKLEKTVTPSLIKQFDSSGMEPDKKESVEKYLKQGLSIEEATAKVTEEMKLDEESDTYESDVKAIEKEAMQQQTVKELGKKTERLNNARLKTTKIRILKEYQKDMTDQEFQSYVEKLYDGKVISKPVFQEFWNN